MLPHNIDLGAFLSSILSQPAEQVFEQLMGEAKVKLDEEAVAEISSDFEYIFEDLALREPGHIADPMMSLFTRIIEDIGEDSFVGLLRQFVESMRIPPELIEDLSMAIFIPHSRQFVREHKDDPGFGRAYTFFRQAYQMYPRATHTAIYKHKDLEGDIEGPRRALEDFQLLTEYFRSLDGEVSTYWTQRLADLWWRAYERPVRRACTILWFLGQELREPGNTKTPPSQLGSLFSQARDFTQASGLQFPFRPNLNELRNAIHGRQTKIDLNLGVELFDKSGNIIDRLEFEELLDAVYDDITFCVYVDQAAQHALFRTLDEQSAFDESWSKVVTALSEHGISEDQLFSHEDY